MNRFIKTLSVFLLVATVSFVSAQQKEVDDSKKGGAKALTKDDIKKGGGKPVVEAKEAPAKLASHETGGPGDKGYNKEKARYQVEGIYYILMRIFDYAATNNISTLEAANLLAERRVNEFIKWHH